MSSTNSNRPRLRDLGIAPGILAPGPRNAITDVPGVLVGLVTLMEGDGIRTGATAILPHAGNLFQDKVPAGLEVGNGYGKLAGATQIVELGEIETPIVLTNTTIFCQCHSRPSSKPQKRPSSTLYCAPKPSRAIEKQPKPDR